MNDGRPTQRVPECGRRDRPLRLSKTRGYQHLRDRTEIPRPVMTHPDRWRLDQLLDWEDRKIALAEAALDEVVTPQRKDALITDLLPQPKRRRKAG